MYIDCLGHTTPTPTSGQNLFHPLVLWFSWRENIRDKKDIELLLVWHKDSYTERFLALLPCTCVLQSELVHLYLTSSLLLGPLPTVASASLRLLYSQNTWLLKEIKVREHGGGTSYTYMNWHKETSCNCLKWGREGVVGNRQWGNI
jgi:hypothetical protein